MTCSEVWLRPARRNKANNIPLDELLNAWQKLAARIDYDDETIAQGVEIIRPAYAEQPAMGAIVALSEEYTPSMPDDDDGTAEEKEELVASNDEVPEGVDSTDDGIVLKQSALQEIALTAKRS